MKSSRLTPWNIVWLVLAVLYFFVPLYGSAQFSLDEGNGKYGFDAYQVILQDPQFTSSFLLSVELAIATVILSMLLMVPTVYWVNLRLPRLRRVIDFLAVLPLVVPPITLAVGVLRLFQPFLWLTSGPQILAVSYVVLALPFTYRSLDAGMRAIDLRTLNEAAQSLGASGTMILWRIVLPNLRAAMLSAAFLTITLVLGEYTMASLMLFNTFPVYIEYIGESKANPAAALAMISLAITWAAMLSILWLGRGSGRRTVNLGGTR